MDTPHPLLHVSTDDASGTWAARACLLAPDGHRLDTREASGKLEPVEVLRKDKSGEAKPEKVAVTEVGLLGTALAAALDLAEGWEGPRILEADAPQNGFLKVSLHDWMREGRLEEGDQGFAHGREAWVRVLEALRSDPPRLRVRWTPGQEG